MTRVFALNHFPVLPPSNGGQHTVHAIVREMALGWPTVLLWTARRAQPSTRVDGGDRQFEVQVLPNLWLQRKVARLLRRPLGAVDNDIGTLLFCARNRHLVRHLLAHCQDGDVILLCHPWLWPAVRQVVAQRRVTLIYDSHNVEHVLKQQSLKPGAISRWLVRRIGAVEAELVRRADLVLASTPLDAQLMSALSGRAGGDFMVGVRGAQPSARADAAAAGRIAQPPARVAVFVGSRHGPNDAAARWIIEVLAPACPQWRFDIAGACGPAAGAVPGPNVRVLGHVADLGSLLAEAGVALNPITLGSGVNIKLFEYLQYGLPVVSTAFGARGVEGGERCGLVIAELDDFPAALEALASRPDRALRLGRAGAEWVRQSFSWSAAGERLRAEVRRLLARGATA